LIWGVLQFPGSCDERDTLHACTLASGEARLIWHEERGLGDVDGVVVPGGFSYGDYLRAGAIARFSPAMEAVAELAATGGPVLGICNGFQVLCEAGLLPGALLLNESMRFVHRQVDLIPATPADGPKTPLYGGKSAHRPPAHRPQDETLSIPVKHGEGRYYAPEDQLDALEANGQVAYRYAPGKNPNGSARDIAGVRSEAGNVLGLMPHPEHAVDPLTGSTDGLRVFEAMAAVAA
jgi:phosphoribosylformylglycinamidine synthase subunit PurQ / glutaminase